MDINACHIHRLVADVALLADRQVLLVRYRDITRYDHQEGWFLPDDYLNPFEHPDEAAVRILRDQVGLTVSATRLDHIESFGNGAWHLIFHYCSEIARAQPPVLTGNMADARWFPLDALPERDDIAHHGWALDVLESILKRAPA
jgi:ADP-ribose pyrophosphatase YjhB (NUDIX family)